MRPNWRRMLPWAALGVLAVLAFGAVPHLHDEVDGQGGHCVLCHAQDAAFLASGLPATLDPAVYSAALPVAESRPTGMTPRGGGSRAPPA